MPTQEPQTVRSRMRERPLVTGAAFAVIALPVLFVAWVVLSVGIGGLQAKSAASSAQVAYHDGDSEQLQSSVADLNAAVQRMNGAISSAPISLATQLPWVGTTISDVQLFTRAGAQGAEAANAIVGDVGPDLYRDGAVNLESLDSLLINLQKVAPQVAAAQSDLESVQARGPLGALMGDARDQGLGFLQIADFAVNDAAPQRAVILDALGAKTPQSYMIALENPAQLRAPGGAPLSATIVSFDKGKMDIPFNGYIAGDAFKRHPLIVYTPASPLPWGEGAAGLGFVNSGAHPDWRLAGEDLTRAWNTAKDPKVDAMIGMDTHAIAALIESTGPIETKGYGTLTADNFAEKVVTDAYLDFQTDNKVRQSLNDQIADTMIKRITSGDLQTVASAALALKSQTPGRHVQMNFQNDALQEMAVDAEAAGAVYQAPTSDTVGIFSRNRNMSKVDVYSERTFVSNVALAADGSATVEQILTAKNAVPDDLDSNIKIGYTTAWSVDEWFLYLPIRARTPKLQVPEGYNAPSIHPDGLGRVVMRTEGPIAPGATVELRMTYTLPPGTFTGSDGEITYNNDLNPQPMQQSVPIEVHVTAPESMGCDSVGAWVDQWTGGGGAPTWVGEQAIRRTISLRCS